MSFGENEETRQWKSQVFPYTIRRIACSTHMIISANSTADIAEHRKMRRPQCNRVNESNANERFPILFNRSDSNYEKSHISPVLPLPFSCFFYEMILYFHHAQSAEPRNKVIGNAVEAFIFSFILLRLPYESQQQDQYRPDSRSALKWKMNEANQNWDGYRFERALDDLLSTNWLGIFGAHKRTHKYERIFIARRVLGNGKKWFSLSRVFVWFCFDLFGPGHVFGGWEALFEVATVGQVKLYCSFTSPFWMLNGHNEWKVRIFCARTRTKANLFSMGIMTC